MRKLLSWTLLMIVGAGELAAEGTYRVVTVAGGGRIHGHVRLAGPPPPPEMLAVTTDNHACGTEVPSRKLVVGADGGVRYAVVSLGDVPAGKPWGSHEHTLAQTACRFEPHVLLIPEDDDLHILNHDRIAHTIRSFGEDAVFNVGQPKFVEKLLVERFTARVSERHVIRLGCDLHPWMEAFAVIQNHPYYAVTDEHGAFELTDVPPGEYRLDLWHETLGTQARRVEVTAGGETAISFELRP